MRGTQNAVFFVNQRLPGSYRDKGGRQAEKGYEVSPRRQTNVLLNSRVLSGNDKKPVWGTVSVEAQVETCRSQRESGQRKPPLTAPTAGKSVESLMTTRRLHNILLLTICQILSKLHKRPCERFSLHTDYTRQQTRLSRFLGIILQIFSISLLPAHFARLQPEIARLHHTIGSYGYMTDSFYAYGNTGQGAIEVFWCQDADCAHGGLAWVRPFSVTAS